MIETWDALKIDLVTDLTIKDDEVLEIQTSDKCSVSEITNLIIAELGNNEKFRAVRIILDNKMAGYLTRTKLYGLFANTRRQLGGSGGASLPGQRRFRHFIFECHEENCHVRTISLIREPTPKCSVHRIPMVYVDES
jgi:hypothetical protein